MLIRIPPYFERLKGQDPPKSIWEGIKRDYDPYDDYADEYDEYDDYENELYGYTDEEEDEDSSDDDEDEDEH